MYFLGKQSYCKWKEHFEVRRIYNAPQRFFVWKNSIVILNVQTDDKQNLIHLLLMVILVQMISASR